LFHRIDVDKSGQISRSEIKSVTRADKKFLLSAMSTSDLMEVFTMLDVDNSGSVDIDEFVDGMELAVSNAPIYIKRMEAKLNLALGQLRQLEGDRQMLFKKWDARFSALQSPKGIDSQSNHLVPTDTSKVLVPTDPSSWANELSKQLAFQTQAIHESIRELQANLHPVCHQASGKGELQPHWMKVQQPPEHDGSALTDMHPSTCSESSLERENVALKEQLLAADAALLNVLQRTRAERLKSPPADHLDPDLLTMTATGTTTYTAAPGMKYQQL